MVSLFQPLTLRGIVLRNRIAVSPMCQYSSQDGFADEWHLVHLGGRAVGGASIVFTEAAAVSPIGRISPEDLGIWKDAHLEMLARIARFVLKQGAQPGVQLAHAGRKASVARPWDGNAPLPVDAGGWQTVAPSAVAFDDGFNLPTPLDEAGLRAVVGEFAAAARRARAAGFTVVELHAAHGYLLHEFLSPLSNRRTDRYGGSFENRIRLVCEVVEAVRGEWPERLPLFIRISASDYVDGGWTADDSVALARVLGPLGVDLVDCSSGGVVPHVRIPVAPGYQVPFAARLKREAGVRTGAVGLITEPQQAEEILTSGQADLVLLARELLRDPHWPLRAARVLGVDGPWPVQYARASR